VPNNRTFLLPGQAKGLPQYRITEACLSIEKGNIMQRHGAPFILILPEENPLHTQDHPFCYNDACPCHQDQKRIAEVHQHVQEGLLTPEEATLVVQGKTI
jgi:hypothetical protein